MKNSEQASRPTPPPGDEPRYYPPTGTYPSPEEAPVTSGQAPPEAPPPRKARRVGTLTMALCLIAAGVVLLLYLFLPGLDYLFIARLSPVVLILLGAEVLYATLRHKGEKLRIDFLSVLLCMLLIGGSLLAAGFSTFYGREYEARQVGNRLAAELEERSRQVMLADGRVPVQDVEWYVGMEGGYVSADMTVGDLRAVDTIQVRVSMRSEYTEAADFAAECRRTLELLRPLVPHLDYASFYTESPPENMDGASFSLWLDSAYQIDDPSLPLEQLVEVEYYGLDNTVHYGETDDAA